MVFHKGLAEGDSKAFEKFSLVIIPFPQLSSFLTNKAKGANHCEQPRKCDNQIRTGKHITQPPLSRSLSECVSLHTPRATLSGALSSRHSSLSRTGGGGSLTIHKLGLRNGQERRGLKVLSSPNPALFSKPAQHSPYSLPHKPTTLGNHPAGSGQAVGEI